MWRARERLGSYLAAPGSSAFVAEARALRRQIDERLWTTGGLLFAAIVLLGGGGLLIRQRLWGGVDLEQFLAACPEAGPAVQRVLSAIRHEVLKHNTMVLTGLVRAIEADEDVTEQAAHVRTSLFGERPGDSVASRLATYARELTQLGRSHDMRINLRRKDPALSALFKGFRVLSAAKRDLERVMQLTPPGRRRLLARLQRATRLLNSDGYEAVRGLLDRLRVLQIDAPLLTGIYERTRNEPGLREVRLRPLALDLAVEQPCGVCIPRSTFEDILGNLIRNAVQSSALHCKEEIPIGLSVVSEVHPVTGHERVAFAVCDDSPQQLSTEDLRRRSVEGGLGLTAELVARYDGSMSVEQIEGWQKAVVVKLPRHQL